jgi:hypothetical protein
MSPDPLKSSCSAPEEVRSRKGLNKPAAGGWEQFTLPALDATGRHPLTHLPPPSHPSTATTTAGL